MADYTIKRGDTLPIMILILSDANGPVNLSSASTIYLHAVHASTGDTLINAPCVKENPLTGRVSYAWATADTSFAGDFEFETLVTWNDGTTERFPNDHNLRLHIEDAVI